MIAIFAYIAYLRPALLLYPNLSGLFATAAPLVFAALAQLVIMSIGDIDLGIGFFIGLVTAVAATILRSDPLTGVLVLIALVVASRRSDCWFRSAAFLRLPRRLPRRSCGLAWVSCCCPFQEGKFPTH